MRRYQWHLLSLVLIAALVCSRYWYRVMWIHGDSMLPSYHDRQVVLLDVRARCYTYGDVVAFECSALHAVLVKRIVGCPGDTVRIADGKIYVNDTIYVEQEYPYIDFAGIAVRGIELGQKEYFVLGDNVAQSRDSRYEEVGCIREKSIFGRVSEMDLQVR